VAWRAAHLSRGAAGFEPVTVHLHPAEPGGVPGRPGTRIGQAPGRLVRESAMRHLCYRHGHSR
jgi:hypothetical protein